jgi:hypothetical protein
MFEHRPDVSAHPGTARPALWLTGRDVLAIGGRADKSYAEEAPHSWGGPTRQPHVCGAVWTHARFAQCVDACTDIQPASPRSSPYPSRRRMKTGKTPLVSFDPGTYVTIRYSGEEPRPTQDRSSAQDDRVRPLPGNPLVLHQTHDHTGAYSALSSFVSGGGSTSLVSIVF